MKRILPVMTAALAMFTSSSQALEAFSTTPVWRVTVTQAMAGQASQAQGKITLDVPEGSCSSGIMKVATQPAQQSTSNIRLCVGMIDGVETITGLQVPAKAGPSQNSASGTASHVLFTLGFQGKQVNLQSQSFSISASQL